MFSKVRTAALCGLTGETVFVETDLNRGLPALSVVGLPDLSVREARERIRSAILNSGFPFPTRRITINLSPAGERKEGTHFDLPIAMGVLSACGTVRESCISEYAFLGELSLQGRLARVRGALPLCMQLRRDGTHKIILPRENLSEAAILPEVELFPADTLTEIVGWFSEDGSGPVPAKTEGVRGGSCRAQEQEDFVDVAGQEGIKRMICVAAAGHHGVLLSGPCGCGKTMLARRIPGILPPLTQEERLEVAQIYSVAGMPEADRILRGERPFRSPHHTITPPAMVGGGRRPAPGEVSLAHCGVLFLDELPEYGREVLELLRQPLEDHRVMVCRSGGNVAFPADFMLVGAMNPCPCGHLGDPGHPCTCSSAQVRRYRSRLSGPLLDRIDLLAEVAAVPYDKLMDRDGGGPRTGSREMGEAVAEAWRRQQLRFSGEGIHFNAQMSSRQIRRFCGLSPEAESLLEQAFSRWRLSARSGQKILRLARTVADLESSEGISAGHMAEAIRYHCPESAERE